MASTMPKSLTVSSRMNGSSNLTSKNQDMPPTTTRKDSTRAVGTGGTRPLSDSAATNKLHAAKSISAPGVTARSVKEIANRIENQADTSKSVSKPVAKPPSRLPNNNSYLRHANTTTSSSDKTTRTPPENITTTRTALTTGARAVGGISRPPCRNRVPVDERESSPTNRVTAATRTTGGARKSLESSHNRGAAPPSQAPCESSRKEKPLLFGEVTGEATTDVGYGIPANHGRPRTNSASAAEAALAMSLQATASDHSPRNHAIVALEDQGSPHKRSLSDTAPKKLNGTVPRRPLQQGPSSHSSPTSSETTKSRPLGSRGTNSHRMGNGSTTERSSTSSSSTRSSNSSLTPRKPSQRPEKLKPWTASGQAPKQRSLPKLSYPGRTSPNTSRTTPRASPVKTRSVSRSSHTSQSLADKSTSASGNRTPSRHVSLRNHPSSSKSPSRPRRLAAVDHDTPVEKIDFSAKQAKIRQGIHQQEQSELKRRQSQRQQAESHSKVTDELKTETDEEGKEREEKIPPERVQDSESPTSPADDDRTEQASERVPLSIDTSTITPVPQPIDYLVNRTASYDSPTLPDISGSFAIAEAPPVSEEIPMSAVSNTTDTTEIENEPQDDGQIPQPDTVSAFENQPPSRAAEVFSGDLKNPSQEATHSQPTATLDLSPSDLAPTSLEVTSKAQVEEGANGSALNQDWRKEILPSSQLASADIPATDPHHHHPPLQEFAEGQPASTGAISKAWLPDSPGEMDKGYLFSIDFDSRTPDMSLGQSLEGDFRSAITVPRNTGGPQSSITATGIQGTNPGQALACDKNWQPPFADAGQRLNPGQASDVFLFSRVHDSLKDPEDEGSLDERSYAPSFSNARTSQTDRHSAGWTEYSVTTASDAAAGLDGEADYERPPTPPPKILQPSSHGYKSFAARPSGPLQSIPRRPPSPPLPHSPPLPAVPPKPAKYSPLPSPRMKDAQAFEDCAVSPRSARFGAISTHHRTSSSTPQYALGTGWLAQPPVPNSRPESKLVEELSDNGVQPALLLKAENDLISGSVETPTLVAETEEQILARQKEAKVQRDRDNVIREIVDSEAKHVKDMYVIKEIWQGTADACPRLTERDKDILFGNITEIATFGSDFLASLEKVKTSDGRRAYRSTPNGHGSASEGSRPPAAAYERMTNIGGIFVEYLARIERVNWPFIINFQTGQAHLEILLQDPAIQIWDKECRRAMVDISECWDLKSLIIKPFQRIIKYKDLLERLSSKTEPDHPDMVHLQKACAEIRDFLVRLNGAMPEPEPGGARNSRPPPKRKETDSRAGFMKTLARKTTKTLVAQGIKSTDEDEDYNRLRIIFSDEYVRLQVVLRDVEYYTRQTNEFVNNFLKILTCIELFIVPGPPGAHPELESKWARFSIAMQSMRQTALPEHIAAVRTQFISPLEQLIELYTNPNIRMAERAKRRIDWEKAMQKKGNFAGTKEGQKTTKSEKYAERYVLLNDQLKRELPLLSLKTNTIADICLGRFVVLQRDWYNLWQQRVKIVLDDDSQVPTDLKAIVETFQTEFSCIDGAMRELSLANRSLLKYSAAMGRSSTQESLPDRLSYTKTEKGRESTEQISRPQSSNGRIRPPITYRAPPADHGSPMIPTPDFGRHNDGGFISPMDPSPPVLPQSSHHFGDGLGLIDSARFHEDNYTSDSMAHSVAQQSSGRPSTSRTSNSRSRLFHGVYDGTGDDSCRKRSDASEPAYPRRDSESAYYFRRGSDPSERSFDYTYDRSRPVSGSTNFSVRIDGPPIGGRPPSALDGSAASNRPFSGVFQSAMPLSDESEPYNARMSRASSLSSLGKSDERGRKDGYNVLYLAASLFEFHIADTKTEGIYPYLTYEAGELFDVIGEKGELWLAKNQDDPPDKIKVGWIWSKHFARLAD